MGDFDYPPNDDQPPAAPEPKAAPTDREALDLDERDALRAEIVNLNDKVLRLAAEIENTRRRGEREKQDAGRYAIANFARDLLGVADAFDRALASAPDDVSAITPETLSALIDGVRMTESALLGALERHGVKRIIPKGEKFDPNLHMAVAQAPGDAPAGYVLDVAQPGFVIGERVLRAAMVVVSTGAPHRQTESQPSAESKDLEAPGSKLDTRA